jgi:peptidoglycan/LPS O-acetylase OafA/YrhL
MERPPASPVIAIDLLRFACAVLVVAFHVDVAYWLTPSPHGQAILPQHLLTGPGTIATRVGWIGVELFFVISGLVIARSASNVGWQDFLRRRVLRLAPGVWVCATLTLVLLATTHAFGAELLPQWLRSVLFWPIGAPIDNSYWTLGVETFFYLIVAATIGAMGSPQKIERLGWVIGLVSGSTWLLAFVWPGMIAQLVANQTATLLQIPFGVFFAIGILIAVTEHRSLGIARIGFAGFLAASAMIAINFHANGREAASGLATSAIAANAIFFAGVALLIAAPRLQAPLSRWITPAAARTIGLMTYPLYLIHQDGGAVVITALLRDGVPLRMAQALTVVLMLALAFWVTRLPEPWVRAQLARALTPRRDRAPDNRPTAFPAGG